MRYTEKNKKDKIRKKGWKQWGKGRREGEGETERWRVIDQIDVRKKNQIQNQI